MKKILSFVIPIACAVLIVWLGFRIGNTSQTLTDPNDENLLDGIIEQETTSIPEIFYGLGSPTKEDAVKFLQEFNAPGYTLLDCTDVYGTIPGMDVYGFFPGDDLTPDAIWGGNAVIQVFLYIDEEEEASAGDRSVDSIVIQLYPQECTEEECRQLIEHVEKILRYSVPDATPAEFDLFISGDGFKALMKRCRSYTDPEYMLQPGTAVNEVYVAGEESITLISHDAYRYVEIALHTPVDAE